MTASAREHLEADANVARARLERTLDELDHRRRDFVDVRVQVRRHARGAALLGLGAAVVVGAAVTVSILRARARRRHRARARVAMVRRAWKRPEAVAVARPRGFFAELGRRVLLSVVAFVAVELITRSIRIPASPRRLGT